MPMLKTASAGTTSLTNIKKYLEDAQRQEQDMYAKEMNLYEQGKISLSDRQVGHLKSYLGEGGRALAVDVSDDLTRRNWARQMDLTRAQHGHDQPSKTGTSRTYYHFVLSPNPDDACTLATIRSYARDWAETNFRNLDRRHEYAIVPHDDNTRGVLHAHIVVNATDKLSGRKLHIDNDEVVHLANSAQEIGLKYGLTPLHEPGAYQQMGVRTQQPVYLSVRERELLNKGAYSWKWELRKTIAELNPLSNDFEDFRERLNRLGYDVTTSPKTGYLTYTHRNGMKVEDSKLGSRFYRESLEQWFNRQKALEDQTYASWELVKISKGQIPWKEEIRRAIDAIAPTVMSLPELQEQLHDRYGIDLILNRRGITYRHASGFKTRDVSIGFRYTMEGLQHNAVLDMELGYPLFGSIADESGAVASRYLPRQARGSVGVDAERAAAQFIYHDLSTMMVRLGLVRIDDVPKVLEEREAGLRREKADLSRMRRDLMRYTHLSALQARREKDRIFLEGFRESADPGLYDETLLRYERISLYLKEQTGEEDILPRRQALSEAYERRLSAYQKRASELSRYSGIYRNYLIGRNVRGFDGMASSSSGSDVRALFETGRTLSAYRIKDFFHLEQAISQRETGLQLTAFKLEKAMAERKDLESVMADIRVYEEARAYIPEAAALKKKSHTLGIDPQLAAGRTAMDRLNAHGVSEDEFGQFKNRYQDALRKEKGLSADKQAQEKDLTALRKAREVCLVVAESAMAKGPRAVGSSGGEDRMPTKEKVTVAKRTEEQRAIEDIMAEARQKRQQAARQAPERSKKMREQER